MSTEIERQSLRPYLAALDANAELLRIARPVALVHELSAFLAAADRGPGFLFEATGTGLPVVGNLLNSRARIGRALGAAADDLEARVNAALDAPLAPVLMDHAPWQAVSEDNPNLATLPVPTFFEHETGPYITAGIIVARDVETGRRNVSIARLKLLGGNRAFIGIAPNHHLAVMARRAQARGQRLPIAVTIGNHPAVMLAACLYLGLGADEYESAGALLGEPLLVAPCSTIDVAVAAGCEVVLEGVLDPAEVIDEGAVSEFHGMYERYKRGPVVTFSRLHRRRDALFQVVEPGFHPEHLLLGAVAIGATTGRAVRAVVPSCENVVVTEAGCGRLDAIVVLRDPLPGDAKKAMFAAWAAVNLVKHVIVVDADINPHDPVQVEWALATRMRAERDLVVVPGVRADRAEPLEVGGVITKVGMDATQAEGDRADWTIAAPPATVLAAVRAELATLLQPVGAREAQQREARTALEEEAPCPPRRTRASSKSSSTGSTRGTLTASRPSAPTTSC